MFCRWADVSVTLLAFTNDVCGWLSLLGEQPAHNMTVAIAMTATAGARGSLTRRSAVGIPCNASFFMFTLQIRAVPPATAKRLNQRRRIGKAIGLGLHQVDPSLLIGLLSAQQRKIPSVAVL